MDTTSFQGWLEDALAHWSVRYECGIEAIDTDHRALFNAALAYTRTNPEDSARVTAEIVAGLNAHFLHHFRREELAMEAAAYPGYSEHFAEHENLERLFALLLGEYEAGHRRFSAAVQRFLEHLLVHHLPRMDAPMIVWIRDHCPREKIEYIVRNFLA